jgi:hypothetical protein
MQRDDLGYSYARSWRALGLGAVVSAPDPPSRWEVFTIIDSEVRSR